MNNYQNKQLEYLKLFRFILDMCTCCITFVYSLMNVYGILFVYYSGI